MTGTGSPPPPTAGSGCCAPRAPSPWPGSPAARRPRTPPGACSGSHYGANEGSSRIRDEPVADPAIIRSLGTGQAAYIYRGGVTFVQVKRLVADPAALAREPTAAGDADDRLQAAAHPAAPATDTKPPTVPPPDAS